VDPLTESAILAASGLAYLAAAIAKRISDVPEVTGIAADLHTDAEALLALASPADSTPAPAPAPAPAPTPPPPPAPPAVVLPRTARRGR
jgi:hypothetical protein